MSFRKILLFLRCARKQASSQRGSHKEARSKSTLYLLIPRSPNTRLLQQTLFPPVKISKLLLSVSSLSFCFCESVFGFPSFHFPSAFFEFLHALTFYSQRFSSTKPFRFFKQITSTRAPGRSSSINNCTPNTNTNTKIRSQIRQCNHC